MTSDSTDDETSRVRPYVITGGQTHRRERSLPVETMVATFGHARVDHLQFERRQIVEICRERPTSIVELASALDLALGITGLLIADLMAQEVVHAQEAPDSDTELIERLIRGVSKL